MASFSIKELAIPESVDIFHLEMKIFNPKHQFNDQSYDQAGSSFGALLRLLPCRAK